MPPISDSASSSPLTVVLIAPNAARRRSLATALGGSRASITREIKEYPSRSDLTTLAGLDCEAVIVDLDEDVEQAMRVIENVSSLNAATTVMAYSSRHDEALMRRTMQAGAREFLAEPLLPETVREAFIRASGRRPKQEKALGKMLVFAATKGGIGVTTIAANFAMALTKESGARVVVVDLDFQLGEIAVGFNMTPTFSVVDAFANAARLDRDLMATLLVHHSCGLAVLASPEEYSFHVPAGDGADKVFRILREEFDFVVVDAGTCRGRIQETLFEMADKLYLVTEMTFPALRNAHRMIGYLSARDDARQLEVVVNRSNPRICKIDEQSAAKALTRPVKWKVPDAYAAVRAAQDSGVPLIMENLPITRVLVQMARAACGKPLHPEKKASKGLDLFGLRGLPGPVEG